MDWGRFKNDLLLWILRNSQPHVVNCISQARKTTDQNLVIRDSFSIHLFDWFLCVCGFFFFFFVKVHWLDYYLVKLATVKFAVNDFDEELEIIYLFLSVNSLLTNSMLYPFPSFIDWWQIYMPQAGAKALR